ncbi:MAG: PIN domain-containing protein [Cyanobacteria bacterium J06558_2]
MTVVELKSSIKIEAIKLRKKYSLKTPDAIIAGTALRLQSSLMTNDQKLLSISEIETYSVII